jgi:hypothetical protein
MKCESTPFTQIDRNYKITSRELRKALDLKGEIINIGLWSSRSPNDIEKGVSPDNDEWEIKTQEILPINDKRRK